MSKNILLATISLNQVAGGLERNIIYLANSLHEQGYKVKVVTFDQNTARAFFKLNKNIYWFKLGRTKPHTSISFRQRLALSIDLFRLIRDNQIDALICFHHGMLARLFIPCFLQSTKIICSERNSLDLYKYIKLRKYNLSFLLLIFVHKITVQFETYIKDYPIFLRHKICVVNNPVHKSAAPVFEGRKKTILCIGRLCEQKRLSLLIDAFTLFEKKNADWTLVIIGQGHLERQLNKQILDANLNTKIKIFPQKENLRDIFSSCTFYCQPSQWEGFPNALAEAMSFGQIPIGFSSTSGVSNLIVDGENGYLISGPETPENLSQAFSRATREVDNLKKLSENAASISEIYSFEVWESQWKYVLADI